MSNIEDDVKWLMENCPKLNSLAVLEPTAQTLGLISVIKNKQIFNDEEYAKLSFMGLLASYIRKIDPKRFQEIHPFSYLQVVNFYLDEKDDGTKFKILVQKILEF
jgi:hypothetical protein